MLSRHEATMQSNNWHSNLRRGHKKQDFRTDLEAIDNVPWSPVLRLLDVEENHLEGHEELITKLEYGLGAAVSRDREGYLGADKSNAFGFLLILNAEHLFSLPQQPHIFCSVGEQVLPMKYR